MKKNCSKRKKATHIDFEQQLSIDVVTKEKILSINSDFTREQFQLLFDFSDIEEFINTIKERRTSTSIQRDVVSNDKILNEVVFVKQHDILSVIEMIIVVSRIKIIRSSKTRKKITTHQKVDTTIQHEQTSSHDFLLDFTLAMTLFDFCRTSHDFDDDVINDDNIKTQVDKRSMLLNDNEKTRTRKRVDQKKDEEKEEANKTSQISKRRRLR